MVRQRKIVAARGIRLQAARKKKGDAAKAQATYQNIQELRATVSVYSGFGARYGL